MENLNRRRALTMISLAGLAACTQKGVQFPQVALAARTWDVRSIQVTVPEGKVVGTNARSLSPQGDLVWFEGGIAQRLPFFIDMVREGAERGTAPLNGPVPVNLAIRIERLHGITPLAQTLLSNTGVLSVQLVAQVFEAKTGAPLTEATPLRADTVPALGDTLQQNYQKGITERGRVVNNMARAIGGWLGAQPDTRQNFSRIGR